MQHYAIIVAAGKGERMQSIIPKQFMLIHQKPMVFYSMLAFLNAIENINLIVVLPKNMKQYEEDINKLFPLKSNITYVQGGETRFESVKNGLNIIPDSINGLVFVHDAARPMLSINLIKNLYETAIKNGNAIPYIDIADSIRKIKDQKSESVNRMDYKIIQTPQVVKINCIKQAFNLPYVDTFTDEASVLEAFGEKIYLCKGENTNIKIQHQSKYI